MGRAANTLTEAMTNQHEAETQPGPLSSPCRVYSLDLSEVFGVGVDRRAKHRPGAISVTDITSSEWCQVQTSFNLHMPKQRTEAMLRGSVRHLQLERELSERVEVEVASEEDACAIRLLNSASKVRALLGSGVTRELHVQAKLQGAWFSGIIDQLALSWCPEQQRMEVTISEHKTRAGQSMPQIPQLRTARLQAMLYKLLLDGAAAAVEPAAAQELYALWRIGPARPLSQPVQQLALAQLGHVATCVEDAMQALRAELAQLPPTSSQLSVTYEAQHGMQQIGVDTFMHNCAWASDRLRHHLAFWTGEAAPEHVPDEEQWKCTRCQHQRICSNVGPELLDPDFEW